MLHKLEFSRSDLYNILFVINISNSKLLWLCEWCSGWFRQGNGAENALIYDSYIFYTQNVRKEKKGPLDGILNMYRQHLKLRKHSKCVTFQGQINKIIILGKESSRRKSSWWHHYCDPHPRVTEPCQSKYLHIFTSYLDLRIYVKMWFSTNSTYGILFSLIQLCNNRASMKTPNCHLNNL